MNEITIFTLNQDCSKFIYLNLIAPSQLKTYSSTQHS